MAFINERISEKDFEKYRFREIDAEYGVHCLKSKAWTVDHQREMYLRRMSSGVLESSHMSEWIFQWNGWLLWLDVRLQDSGSNLDIGSGWAKILISDIRVFGALSESIPEDLKNRIDDLREDIRDAFHAYRDAGIYSVLKEYSLELAFRGEV